MNSFILVLEHFKEWLFQKISGNIHTLHNFIMVKICWKCTASSSFWGISKDGNPNSICFLCYVYHSGLGYLYCRKSGKIVYFACVIFLTGKIIVEFSMFKHPCLDLSGFVWRNVCYKTCVVNPFFLSFDWIKLVLNWIILDIKDSKKRSHS